MPNKPYFRPKTLRARADRPSAWHDTVEDAGCRTREPTDAGARAAKILNIPWCSPQPGGLYSGTAAGGIQRRSSPMPARRA